MTPLNPGLAKAQPQLTGSARREDSFAGRIKHSRANNSAESESARRRRAGVCYAFIPDSGRLLAHCSRIMRPRAIRAHSRGARAYSARAFVCAALLLRAVVSCCPTGCIHRGKFYLANLPVFACPPTPSAHPRSSSRSCFPLSRVFVSPAIFAPRKVASDFPGIERGLITRAPRDRPSHLIPGIFTGNTGETGSSPFAAVNYNVTFDLAHAARPLSERILRRDLFVNFGVDSVAGGSRAGSDGRLPEFHRLRTIFGGNEIFAGAAKFVVAELAASVG